MGQWVEGGAAGSMAGVVSEMPCNKSLGGIVHRDRKEDRQCVDRQVAYEFIHKSGF
jgi:hypothetical protein